MSRTTRTLLRSGTLAPLSPKSKTFQPLRTPLLRFDSRFSHSQVSPEVWILSCGNLPQDLKAIALSEALGFPYSIKPIPLSAGQGINRLKCIFAKASLGFIRLLGAEKRLQKFSPIFTRPPFPYYILASSPEAIPYMWLSQAASQNRACTIFLGNPNISFNYFNFVTLSRYEVENRFMFQPKNAILTKLALHGVTSKNSYNVDNKHLELPSDAVLKVAVFLGSTKSTECQLKLKDYDKLENYLKELTNHKVVELFIRLDPNCDKQFLKVMTQLFSKYLRNVHIWSGVNEDPFIKFLTQATHVVATADLVDVFSAAIFLKKACYVFGLNQSSNSLRNHYFMLLKAGLVRPWSVASPERKLEKGSDFMSQHGYFESWGSSNTIEGQHPAEILAKQIVNWKSNNLPK